MAVQQTNNEPLPGYRLLEPLGQGGFGEVWKCEAPGGLVKAIKFVPGTSSHDRNAPSGVPQELRAFQHITSIRHPFLLSLDRVELVEGDLVIVTELADRSLKDVLARYRTAGAPGIPRDDLLGYLREAAEVLDLLNQQHHLQHLDVKPGNLFLVAGHIKVADLGLISCLAELTGTEPASVQLGAVLPIYAAPESFLGTTSTSSDQYSLAITYHELLTGKVPFGGKNFRQLALQHMQSVPDLSFLPESDRPAVARALAKEPKDRFPSCSAFVQALTVGLTGASEVRVPARTYFALESEPKQPKLATAYDFKIGDTNATATNIPVVKPLVPPVAGAEFASLRLLECVSRQPNGELWRGLTTDGQKRFVRFVFDVEDARATGDPFARLEEVKHDCLASLEIVRDGSNRVGLVSEAGDENLGLSLKECMQAGMAGIPRAELLAHLSDVATALDELFHQHRLLHLTLSPRTIALMEGKARLLDFGLAELFWLPSGQQAGGLNARYAAPELFNGQLSRQADQFSLALIFQEMLTGVHAYRNLNPRQLANARQRGNPDLGMLPSTDRLLLLRALHVEPERRFDSNAEFIAALARATVRPTTPAPYSATRQTAVSVPKVVVPSRASPVVSVSSTAAINELVALAGEGREVRERGGMRYLMTPGVSILHHCCARVIPSVLLLKVTGFREQWKATLVEREEGRFVYHLPLGGSVWQRTFGTPPTLSVEIRCEAPTQGDATLSEASVEIWPLGCSQNKAVEVLESMGPRVLESVRTYLNAHPERRAQMRLPYESVVQVAPVHDGVLGDAIMSMTRDISQNGMSVLMPCRPPAAQVCVLVSLPSRHEPATIAARVLRVRPQKDGRFEVGLIFTS
jgi:serine/threonine protein kinase